MAKCVVCSNSAGPFNSLHKSCLSTYRDTEKCLQEKISSCIAASKNLLEQVEEIQACRSSTNFSSALFKELLINAWSTQASRCVKSASTNPTAANNLLKLAEHFEIHEQNVDQNFFTRLDNVKTLDRLQNNQRIEANIERAPEALVLSDGEKIIWTFKDIEKTEQQRYSQEQTWTVLRSVLNNALLKSRYKQLATKTEIAGELFVTNRALYYLNENQLTTIQFSDIHSITPMKNGIRIQANTSGATPETFITGDGRFTYALLQYAQKQ